MLRLGKLRLVASPDGAEGSLTIHADARVYATVLPAGARTELVVRPRRHAWIHVAKGKASVGGQELAAGDAAYTSDEGTIPIEGVDGAEILAFDLG